MFNDSFALKVKWGKEGGSIGDGNHAIILCVGAYSAAVVPNCVYVFPSLPRTGCYLPSGRRRLGRSGHAGRIDYKMYTCYRYAELRRSSVSDTLDVRVL